MASSVKRAIKNALTFSLSLILTVGIIGGVIIYLLPTSDKSTAVTTKETGLARDVKILLCEVENDINYGLTISFEKKQVKVKRLYFKNTPNTSGGIPAIIKSARESFGECEKALIITTTQLAALIDYVGGVPIDVDSSLGSICGIDSGYQQVAGVAAIKIFEVEKHNTALCLNIIEDLCLSWCKILSNKRDFFKLLDLTNNNISYTDYLPLQNNFKKF